jgi:hypothetical protein
MPRTELSFRKIKTNKKWSFYQMVQSVVGKESQLSVTMMGQNGIISSMFGRLRHNILEESSQ